MAAVVLMFWFGLSDIFTSLVTDEDVVAYCERSREATLKRLYEQGLAVAISECEVGYPVVFYDPISGEESRSISWQQMRSELEKATYR